ncbi:unnamed protein product [Blepharisma stoltei]|uniref:Uncharacterized protein n=1 Tax=Blepharisma stoltei TaxID=1481888 RepID=A0AAU9JUG5_9CILI|nr:unnamed protein product [Blepharisma stoltei]
MLYDIKKQINRKKHYRKKPSLEILAKNFQEKTPSDVRYPKKLQEKTPMVVKSWKIPGKKPLTHPHYFLCKKFWYKLNVSS